MNELPIGSIWKERWGVIDGLRIIVSVHEAHNPPSGMLLITYHDLDDGETRSVMSTKGSWLYDWTLVSD